jgi:hypothetical protein
LTLSLAGGIQPGKLTRYVAGAVADAEGADTLLQRFQLLVYPDTQPEFQLIDRLPNTAAFDAVLSIVERLDKLDPIVLGAVPTKQGIPAVRFSLEAQPIFNDWYTKLQLEIRSPELQFAGAYQAHLGKYGSLMAKLALIFHLLMVADGTAIGGAISVQAAELAVAWCDYLKAHVRKLYAVELAQASDPIVALASKIEQGEIKDGCTVREVQRHKVKGLKTADAVRDALKELEKLDWVKLEKVAPKGKKPSEIVRINPAILEDL